MAKETNNASNAQQSTESKRMFFLDLDRTKATSVNTEFYVTAQEAENAQNLIDGQRDLFLNVKKTYKNKDGQVRSILDNVDGALFVFAYKAVTAGILDAKEIPDIRFAYLCNRIQPAQAPKADTDRKKMFFLDGIVFARIHGKTYLVADESTKTFPYVQTKFFEEEDGLMSRDACRLIGRNERLPINAYYAQSYGAVFTETLGRTYADSTTSSSKRYRPSKNLVQDIRRYILDCGADNADRKYILDVVDSMLSGTLPFETALEVGNGSSPVRNTAVMPPAEAIDFEAQLAKFDNHRDFS